MNGPLRLPHEIGGSYFKCVSQFENLSSEQRPDVMWACWLYRVQVINIRESMSLEFKKLSALSISKLLSFKSQLNTLPILFVVQFESKT